MKKLNHIFLLSFCCLIWLIYFLLGLTNNYYQAWTFTQHLINAGDIIILIWPMVYVILKNITSEKFLIHSIWFAFYGSVPFMILDFIYLFIIKGYDYSYLKTYWYLTIFYFIVWIEMPLVGYYLERKAQKERNFHNNL